MAAPCRSRSVRSLPATPSLSAFSATASPKPSTSRWASFTANNQVAENGGSGIGAAWKTRPRCRQPHARTSARSSTSRRNVNGAAIQSVRPASPADDAGLAPGDVILEVNRQPVDNAQKLRERSSLRSRRQGHPAPRLVEGRNNLPRCCTRTRDREQHVNQNGDGPIRARPSTRPKTRLPHPGQRTLPQAWEPRILAIAPSR